MFYRIEKNEEVKVLFIQGYIMKNCLVRVKGTKRFVATTTVALVADELTDTHYGVCVKHLRFARPWQEGLVQGQFTSNRRLRPACRYAQLEKLSIPGGFEQILVAPDEEAVPDYSMSGSTGWLVKKEWVPSIQAHLPRLRPSGNLKKVWVESVGYVNTPSECCLKVHLEHPPAGERIAYYDRPRGVESSSNWQLYEITFDRGDGRVVSIRTQNCTPYPHPVVWCLRPTQREVSVGTRVPGYWNK